MNVDGIDWATLHHEAAHRHPVHVDQGVMDVLSASVYPRQRPAENAVAQVRQLYGGLLARDDEDDSVAIVDAPVEQDSGRPRKKSKGNKPSPADSNDVSDDSAKKQRGRPRLEGRDKTAVDRRRTQIRLAQRAYRNRKETTIVTLKQRNEELQESITRMNQTFAQLYNDLTNSGILGGRTDFQHRMHALHEDLLQLASLELSNEEDASTSEAKSKKPSPSPQERADRNDKTASPSSSSFSSNQPSASTELIRPSDSKRQIPADAGGASSPSLAYRPNNDPAAYNTSYFDVPVPGFSSRVVANTDPPMGDWVEQGLDFERAFPLRSTYTYSFQETTFARRLHRLCIERAFRNLGNPGMDPVWIARTFRLALHLHNRTAIRSRFRELLRRKAGEDLENWDVPYFNIGGAGSHFPRRNKQGQLVFPPNLHSAIKAPGPWRLIDDDEEPPPPEAVQQMLDEMGFGGEWFDSHDVEHYLRLKGIFLDGSSSYAEVDVSLLKFNDGPTMLITPPTGTSPSSSHSPGPHDTSMGEFNFGTDLVHHSASMNNSGPYNDFGSGYNWSDGSASAIHGSQSLLQTPDQSLGLRRGFITLDIDRFLDRVIVGGACLGRAPGFRRESVDRALSLAIQESF